MLDKKLNVTLYARPLRGLCRNGVEIIPIGPEPSFQKYFCSFLEESGHHATQATNDQPFKINADAVVLIFGSVNWYPKVFRQLMAIPVAQRPFVVIWHMEPLPPPKKAGLPWPRLNIKQIKKILRRDDRAADPYSYFFRLRHLYKKKAL